MGYADEIGFSFEQQPPEVTEAITLEIPWDGADAEVEDWCARKFGGPLCMTVAEAQETAERAWGVYEGKYPGDAAMVTALKVLAAWAVVHRFKNRRSCGRGAAQ